MRQFTRTTTASSADRLLVWLGPPFFSTRLSSLGWEVLHREHNLAEVRTWDHILEYTGGRVPDVVVAADGSTPPLLAGMEAFPCLTVLYAVDTHVHSWYPLYAQGFDICLVSLKDHVPQFCKGRLTARDVWWWPAYARDEHRPPENPAAPVWDLLFVGTVDQERTPERYRFFTALQKEFSGLHVTRGNFIELFPKARLLLNECAAGDLNFRVFEALGCGGCLLTPRIGHGLTELFADKRDLFLYAQHDPASLLPLVAELLADEPLLRRVAASGLAAVDAKHRASHRAAEFTRRLGALFDSGEAERRIALRRSGAAAMHAEYLRVLYLHHAESLEGSPLREAYLRAARSR